MAALVIGWAKSAGVSAGSQAKWLLLLVAGVPNELQ
jgi:hypothetical protein